MNAGVSVIRASSKARSLKRFIETYPGSSFPTKCETTDGEILVLKMKGAGNGVESLIFEFIVNRIASRIGLNVPGVCPVDIPSDFPWEFGTDEFDDIVTKSFGINLGLAHVQSAAPVEPGDYAALPYEVISQIVTLDLLFCNFDRSAESRNLLRDQRGGYWIIDHGSCRFLFQTDGSLELPRDHFLFGRERDVSKEILSRVTPEIVEDALRELPEPWLNDGRMNRLALSSVLGERLLRLQRSPEE